VHFLVSEVTLYVAVESFNGTAKCPAVARLNQYYRGNSLIKNTCPHTITIGPWA